jgi:hypothetical protein
MNKTLLCTMALAFALVCPTAGAGSAEGTITRYFSLEWPNTPPLLFFFISGAVSLPAACGSETAIANRWVIRTDTPAGKTHMAVIMTARLMGRRVAVFGRNECDLWGDTETILYVDMRD